MKKLFLSLQPLMWCNKGNDKQLKLSPLYKKEKHTITIP